MPLDANVAVTTVKSLVVHKLMKDGDGFKPELRDAPNAVSETTAKVVGLLIAEYAKRSGKAHGRFEKDEDNYPVQGYLREYFDVGSTFLEATTAMMRTLCAKAKGTAAAPGGVIMAHVQTGGLDHVMVAIVTEEWGAAMNTEMELAGSDYLDLKGFRFAGRVNLTEWQAGGDKYLSFLRGKGQVSGYFKVFLGCDSSVTDAAETRTLKEALDEFVLQAVLDEKAKQEFFDKAFDICARLHKNRMPIDLDAFANELWPHDPNKLSEVFGAPERKLSDGFVPDRRVFKSFVQFAGKTKTWKVEFSREAINRRDIIFNKDETLTLTNLPRDLKQRLKQELQEEDE
jgi:nucleoid-associated protein